MNYSPRWESASDLAREKAIRDEVAAHWGLHAIKPDDRHILDAVFTDIAVSEHGIAPKIVAGAEIKDRDLIFGVRREEGYRIATNKVVCAQQWHATMGVPCWLIVRFNDGIIRCARLRFPLPKPSACWAGAPKRINTDSNAMEPHAIVPWSWFKKLYDDTDNL